MPDYSYDLVVRNGTVVDGTGADPVQADVAVKDGRIVAVGRVAGSGANEIEARDRIVTPGFIDVHTHYDGQLTWSDRLSPSSNHGVTTVVTGNCGVGFAPCRPQDRDNLIRLMEGVEDIPEIVMTEGLPWDWESFPDFLASVERKPHDIDFAVMLPHSPLRVFVMGERAVNLEAATEADRAQMRVLAKQAMQAGAIGFGTSRNVFHQASDGSSIPSMTAEVAELHEIAAGMADAGRGNLQAIVQTATPGLADYEFFHDVSRVSGRPLSYTLLQIENSGPLWQQVADAIGRDRAAGIDVKGQVINRPVGFMLGLEASLNPFSLHPFYAEKLAPLPLAQRVAEMKKPDVRERLLSEQPTLKHINVSTISRWARMYEMGEVPDYEPEPSTSIGARAAATGQDPYAIAYDLLLARDGHALLMVTSTNYGAGNLDHTLELMKRDDMVLALGDGGAHYGMICDASYSTATLTHWVRDRTRGSKITLPQAINMLTQRPADLYRFKDRGRIAVGMKADLNVIDMDRLQLFSPSMIYDLPGGGKRLTQTASGYETTIVSGVAVQREGIDTGARPGKLVRDAGI
jgi:N-acyl-D-amino-acid deacylase